MLTIHDSRSTESAPMQIALPSASPTAVWVPAQVHEQSATPPAARLVPPEMREQVVTAQFARDRAVVIEAANSPMAGNDDSNTLGIVLLVSGLALLVPLTLYSSAHVAFDR